MGNAAYARQRAKETAQVKRSDARAMAVWVVTAPKSLPEGERRAFFAHAYEFMRDRYGGERNVVCCCVHMDEATPHMHFAFVPVAVDKEKGTEKLCAKEVITRSDLKTAHQDMQRHLEKKMGHSVEILNEATKEGNRAIAELKAQTAIEKLNAINLQLEDLEKRRAGLEGEIASLSKDISWRGEVEKISLGRTLTGAVKGLTLEEAKALKAAASESLTLRRQLESLEAKAAGLEKECLLLKGKNAKLAERDDLRAKRLSEALQSLGSLERQMRLIERALAKDEGLRDQVGRAVDRERRIERDRGLDLDR